MPTTKKQQAVLRLLAEDGFGTGTARRINDRLEGPQYGSDRWTLSQVRGQLRALTTRGLVERTVSTGGRRSVRFQVTDAGRSEVS